MADRKGKLIAALSFAVLILLIMVAHLSGGQPVVAQNPYMAVNLAAGPIIRTYEIGKTYKVQIWQSIAQNPENIIGVSARDLHLLFGNSSFIRQEGHSSIWQYSNGSCVLDIFFEGREDRAADLAPAVYYEIRATAPDGPDGKDVNKAACVADLLKGSAGPYMVGVSAFYKAVME